MMKLPKLELGSNWKIVVKRAWSMRLMAIAAVLSGLEVALPFVFDARPVAPGVFAAVSGAVTIGAFVTRIMVQRYDNG